MCFFERVEKTRDVFTGPIARIFKRNSHKTRVPGRPNTIVAVKWFSQNKLLFGFSKFPRHLVLKKSNNGGRVRNQWSGQLRSASRVKDNENR